MIAYETRYDRLGRTGARNIIEWCEQQGAQLRFTDAVDLVSVNVNDPVYLEDIVQVAIDVLNEESPIGHWYYLTSDANIHLDIELEVDQ